MTSVPSTTLVESASTVLDFRRPDVVHRHQRLVAHRQHALERSRLGRLAEGVVHLVGRGGLLDDAGERHDRDVRASAPAGRRRRSCPSPPESPATSPWRRRWWSGMIESAAARARRRSLCGRSRISWSLVYECTVVMNPLTKPNRSRITFTTGTRQLVVQLALEMTWCFGGVVRLVVDAVDDRDVFLLGRRRDDDLLGAGGQVRAPPGPGR